MSGKKIQRGEKAASNPTLIIALLGLIGTAITAYFAYLSSVKPTEITISATQTANSIVSPNADAPQSPNLFSAQPITYLPIENKDELIQSFKLEGSGARANLRFIASNFGIDFNFSAPLDMKCYLLEESLLDHFELRRHISVDISRFPGGGYGGSWSQSWLLMQNDEVVEHCSNQTLRSMPVTDGDLIHFKVGWELLVPAALIIEPTPTKGPPSPTKTPIPFISPPNLYP